MQDTKVGAFALEPFWVNGVHVEPSALRLSKADAETLLEPKVMALLTVLAQKPHALWQRAQLLEEIWPNGFGSDESLSRLVSLLRKSLSQNYGIDGLVVTVPKLGYRLDAAVDYTSGLPSQLQMLALAGNPIEGKKRLAVLPFRSMAYPDDNGFFADGIVDELITTLGKSPQLLVAGRTSSFHFKSSEKSPAQIAAELNVTHLVDGSVQRKDQEIRINVSLIDAATGFEEWSYGYDGSFDHIFATRNEVAQAVNDGIAKALNLTSGAPTVRGLTNSREAYGLYLQGRALTIRGFGEGVIEKAVALLEKALEIDPDFAVAWTALAEAEVSVTVYTPCTNRVERVAKAAGYAAKAIALSSDQGHARIVLAFHEWTKNNIVGAIDLAFEAYRLEPNNPDVVNRLGSFLLYIGRCEDALPYIEASIEQDPVNGRAYLMLASVQLNLGNIDAAIAAGQRVVDLGFPSMTLAQALAAKGDREAAIEAYQLTKKLMNTVIFAPEGTSPMSPEAMDAYWLMAAKALWSGDPAMRQVYCGVVDMLHATLSDPCDSTVVWAAVYMGYVDMAFKSLGQQITTSNFHAFASLWNEFDPTQQIRLDPGFLEFAGRIGLRAAWEKYGWPDRLPRPSF